MHDLYESDHLSWAVSLLTSSLTEFQNNEMQFHKLHDHYESFPTWRGPPLRVNWENSLHFATPPLVSPRNDVWATTAKFHTDDDASLPRCGWCFWLVKANFQPIRLTTQIWVVSRHQHGISAFVSQTPFCGENNCGVAKCRLVSAAALSVTLSSQSHYWIIYAISLKFIPFTNFKNRSNAT